MPINPFLFMLAILISLVLVFLYFLYSSTRWHDESAHKTTQPVEYQVEHRLSQLGVSKGKRQEAARQLTEIVNQQVINETKKVTEKMEKLIVEKDKEVAELHAKYDLVEESYQLLGKQKAQTESVVRSIAKGVIVLDDNGCVVFMNPEAEKILGEKSKDLVGKQINKLKGAHIISMVNEEGIEENLEGIQDSGKDELKENTAVIETVHGQTKGVVSTPPNPDYRKKVEEYKKEFLANVTHELRSPLICIQKAIHGLRDRIPSEERPYFDIAMRNIIKLESMVNEILDASKLEMGKIQLHYEMLALAPFVQGIKENFSSWSAEKQIEIKPQLPKEDVSFEADINRLSQVLSNFVSNALKFTPRRGTVTIEARVLGETTPGSGYLQIGVRDTGPGISEEDQKNIFEKFAYINTQPTEGERSTGLGLSLSKEIIELHQGHIWVESSPNQGSCFAFRIPLRKP